MFDAFRRSDGAPSSRLARLADRAGTAPVSDGLPPDQDWIVVDDDPEPRPPRQPWWRARAGDLIERWLPDGTRVSSAASRRKRVIAAAVGVVVVCGVVVVALTGTPAPEQAPVLPAAVGASPRPVSATSNTGPGSASVVVSVVGKVARPGLVTVPEGARVDDVVRACGGLVPGAEIGSLNLARKVSDGEQIYVAVPGAAPVEGAADQPGAPGPVDLNSASAAQLDTLPGVGEVTAQRIVQWRAQHGRFASVEQLREVDGIGDGRFATLRELVVVR